MSGKLTLGNRKHSGRTFIIRNGVEPMDSSRPDERIPVDLDMRVWGLGADGHAFSQHARARNISAGGALLCGIEHDLKVGDTIGVKAGEQKTRCKVVWAKNTQSPQKIQVGVQLVSKQECPWTALLPNSDRSAPIAVPGCRRWERHKINVLIALYDERTSVPIRITATDVSGSGCYVETLSPFPIGTALFAELWTGPEKIHTRALVRTSDPRIGMGIEFVGLKTEEQQRLQAYFHALDPFGCSIEHQSVRANKTDN